MVNQQSQLVDELTATGYRGFFLVYGHSEIDAIWNQSNAPAALAKLALDKAAPLEARFLAAEILFYKDSTYPPDSAKVTLAQVYADALANDIMLVANPWGLPDHLASVGQHMVALGDAAVPALTALLDDTTGLVFEGSKEATVGNSYDYRVKDFAAYFISQIKNLPYTVYQTPAERDVEIDKLKKKLS